MGLLKDSQIIDELAIITYALVKDDQIVKQAGLLEDFKSSLQGFQSEIKQEAGRVGVLGLLGDSAFTGWILTSKIGLFWKLAFALLPAVGITPSSVISFVYSMVKDTVEEKGKFEQSDVTRITDQTVDRFAKTASLSTLYELKKDGNLHKVAFDIARIEKFGKNWWESIPKSMKDYFSSQKDYGEKKASWGGKILKFIIGAMLTAFVGLSINTLARGVGKSLGIPQIIESPTTQTTTTLTSGIFGDRKPTSSPAPSLPKNYFPMPIVHNLKHSGHGNNYHPSDDESLWVAPIIKGYDSDKIKSTLLYWTFKIYPELEKYEDLVKKLKSFNITASILEKSIIPSNPKYLAMPRNSDLHSWTDVVDLFAGHAAQQIEESNEK